eukprot:TRINITY_DN972_c0_g1_i5.p1 TRINITY_DN972_c0_g1~~TRINITY_DN972_c0_g1_i5.p1  ORF type:complete len:473 (+),score=73.54 TRINITY_DN972_c0_g1_i5:777-2195(+)
MLLLIVGLSGAFFATVGRTEPAKYAWDDTYKAEYPALFGYVDAATLTKQDILKFDAYKTNVVDGYRRFWNTLYPRVDPPIYYASNNTMGPSKELDSFAELLEVFPKGYDVGPMDPGAQTLWLYTDLGEGAFLLRTILLAGETKTLVRLTVLPAADSFPVATSVGVTVFLNTTLNTTWANVPTNFSTALQKGRLLTSDHGHVDNLAHFPGYTTYAAKILYYLLDNGTMVTVAIQLGQDPATAPLLTAYDARLAPGYPYNWLYARACARHAIALQSSFYHVATLHWPVETIHVALNRALPEDHVIRQLLYAFTDYAAVLNTLSRIPGAFPFKLTTQGVATAVSSIQKDTNFIKDFDFVGSLAARGIAAPPAGAPDFADVAEMRILQQELYALQADFAAEFVAATYSSDKHVADDRHLQAFATELSSPARGNLGPLTNSGDVVTRGDLVGVLTRILHRRLLHGAVSKRTLDNYFL